MPDDKATKPDKPERVMGEDPRLRRPEQLPIAVLLSMIAGLLGGLSLIVGLLWWLVTKTFGLGPKAFVIVGAVCIIYYLVVNASNIFGSFRQRRLVTGANTIVFAIMIFGVIVLLNVMAVRHPFFRYDSTESKRFSLSDQTLQIIKGLNEDIKLVAFMTPEYLRYAEIRSRLDDYSAVSPRVKVEFYDPKIRKDKVDEYNVTMPNCIIVSAGDKKETVTGGEEERITSAILAITTGEKTKIYFLAGHGELDPDGYEAESAGMIKDALESQQYAVETLTIMNQDTPAVPSDAAAVVIAGAQHPVPEAEMKALEKYADQGGKLFIALAPNPTAPDFESILKPRGVSPLKGKLIDPDANHHWQAPTIPAVLAPEQHQITEKLELLVLPTARALEIEEGPEPPPSYPGTPPPPTQKAAPLLKTSAEAWLDEIGEDGKGNGIKDGSETTGPLALAAAIDESKKDPAATPPGMPPPEDDEDAPGTRIVVVAGSQFMTRGIIDAGVWANGYFVLNSINWLVSNEKLISIPPKEVDTPYLAMTGAQKAIAAVLTLFIVPGLVILAGGFVWWRRRR